MTIMNLVTLKAGAKHELLFNDTASSLYYEKMAVIDAVC